MNLRFVLSTPKQEPATSLGLLVLRLVVGLAFVMHGSTKILDPFGWMGAESHVPAVLQALAAASEFGGGLAWMLGALVPVASLGIASTMVVALGKHVLIRRDPFVDPGGSSYELALGYLAVAALLLLAGPGRFSMDRLLFGQRGQSGNPGAPPDL